MKFTFITWPIRALFRLIAGSLQSVDKKKVHLIFDEFGWSSDVSGAITTQLKMLNLNWTHYPDSIDGIINRPNQVILFNAKQKGSDQHKAAKSIAEKYNIEIIYFEGASDLMEKIARYAKS